MSYSIMITGRIKHDEFERFCIRNRWQFKEKKDKELMFRWKNIDVILKQDCFNDVVYIIMPWKSKNWRELYPVASAIHEKFGGKLVGEGIKEGDKHLHRDGWERQFILDTGEK